MGIKNTNFFKNLSLKLSLKKGIPPHQQNIDFPQQSRTFSKEYGFELNKTDIGIFLKQKLKEGFFQLSNIESIIEHANQSGYLDPEVGLELEKCFKDENCDIYIKTVMSDDVPSIFNEGVRCLENISSGFVQPVESIKNISLEHSITKAPEFILAVGDLKRAYGFSQGMNPVDGTLIIKTPKDMTKEEMIYYNDETGFYNIRPELIVGFVPVDANHKITEFQKREELSNIKNY